MDALYVRLVDAGFGADAFAISQLSLPGLRVVLTEMLQEKTAAVSRFGGFPDVPPGFEWPVWSGAPLSFIGQIRLEEIAGSQSSALLPATGVLSFFYDSTQRAWGFEPTDLGSARVYWFRSELEPAGQQAIPEPSYDEHRANMKDILSLPPPEAPVVQELQLSSETMEEYEAFWEQSLEDSGPFPLHQILGHPAPIQETMQLQCQLVTSGISCGNIAGYTDPRRSVLEPQAGEWRLLLQVDSDESTGMRWADNGMLYFWIREPDLVAGRFERCWAILQSQ